MFVVSRRNIVLPGPNGEKFRMAKDYMGPVPDWAENSDYLKALAADGKVILSERGTDKDFSKKEKKPRKPAKEPEQKSPEQDSKEDRSDSEGQKAPDPENIPENPDAVAE